MLQPVTTRIDEDKCIGCGQCVSVCPNQTLALRNGKAVVVGTRSMNCGHCAAICPTEAIKVESLENDIFRFETFKHDDTWLPYGKFDTAQLVRLMRSRRSCRNYSEKEVDRSLLEDLVKIGISAPSGTNSQMWAFIIFHTRKDVKLLGDKIGQFFRKLNQMAEKGWLRYLLKLAGNSQLEEYYNQYYGSVKQSLEDYRKSGIDRLFHGAPALIIITCRPGASCPTEDSLLAAQNILLAAHTMGLGTCLIGFAVASMNKEKSIKRFAGIPDEETVYAVIAVGYPNEEYYRLPGRKKVTVRYFQAAG